MLKIARSMAILGGVVLVALVVITCVSVLGRSANTLGHTPWIVSLFEPLAALFKKLGPVRGDFELVEAGVAFAIFCFLPWCQMVQGHATVDLVTNYLPEPARRFLTMLWEVLLAAVLGIITWRLIVGTLDKAGNGETTFLLQFPVWWAFAACAAAAVVASVIGAYVAVIRMQELAKNTDLLVRDAGVGH
ncbi:MAG: TRAP transporter small permease [Burkholderiaceae bacterium]